MSSKIKCPHCGSLNVVVNDNDNKALYRCEICRTLFGKVNDSKNVASTKLISFALDVKLLFGASYCFKIVESDGKSEYSITKNEKIELSSGILANESWQEFKRLLFDDIYIDKWKAVYFDPSVSDGVKWSLKISFLRKHSLFFSGCNGYPPYWNELIALLKKYIPLDGEIYEALLVQD